MTARFGSIFAATGVGNRSVTVAVRCRHLCTWHGAPGKKPRGQGTLAEIIYQHGFADRIGGAYVEEPVSIRRDIRRAASVYYRDRAGLASSVGEHQERISIRLSRAAENNPLRRHSFKP